MGTRPLPRVVVESVVVVVVDSADPDKVRALVEWQTLPILVVACLKAVALSLVV